MLHKGSTRSRARSRNDNNVGAEIGQNNINANAAQSATAAWAAAVLAELPGGDIVAGTHFNQLQANLPSTAFICGMSCRPAGCGRGRWRPRGLHGKCASVYGPQQPWPTCHAVEAPQVSANCRQSLQAAARGVLRGGGEGCRLCCRHRDVANLDT